MSTSIKFLLSLIVSLYTCCNCSAQDPAMNKKERITKDSVMLIDTAGRNIILSGPRINKYDFSEFWHETGLFIMHPAHWKGKDWLTLAAAGGLTYLVMQYDVRIRNEAVNHYEVKYQNHPLIQIGDQWGGFYVTPAVIALLIVHGWTTHNSTTKKLGYEIVQAALYSETISFISKGIIGRERPWYTDNPYHFTPFTFFNGRQNSFPAGHVDAAMAMSTVLAKNTSSVFLKVLAYIPSALTIADRIVRNEHWASDVFIGGTLGYFVGNWVVNLHDQKQSKVQVSSLYPVSIRIAIN